jgi:hypothetical protein
MATTLDRDPGTINTAATVRNERIDVQEGWSHHTLPTRYVFREIDFFVDGNGHLQFCFRNADFVKPLNGLTIEQVAATFRTPPRPEPEFLIATALEEPPQTPLDLEIWGDEPIYVIYRLYGPRNMTFNPGQKAMSHKDGSVQNRYGLLRHLGPAGAGSVMGVENCELIYFACRPLGETHYRDRFNLRVDLEQAPVNGERRIIELEIDPDIRFPGGSVTDPNP